ncbi:A24 family peptidase [Sphingobium nicotianae]|uniref:Prepilin peptidase n=1 Tax=Sphingobium nicotianae TaxID=2782607 RepID=A0A9X1DCA9_9SPHN|nr:prepilin peptidase [Sphingobium nicotianae]MBT2187254.1 prepilin peptidase [Sphingobium nicotianae]
MSHAAIACQILACALLVGAAFQDLRTRSIANGWSVALLVLFAVAYALGVIAGPLVSHLLHFALALSVGMILFALRWFGGGDAKLYAAIALWFSLGNSLYLFVSVALAGLVLAVAHLLIRMVQSKETRARAIREGKIAYGVAIAAGAIAALPRVML